MRPSCSGYAVFVSPDFICSSAQDSAGESMPEGGDAGAAYFPEVAPFEGLSSAADASFDALLSARAECADYL